MTDETTDLTIWGREHAEKLLAPLGNRWLHTQGVARLAEQISQALPQEDRTLLYPNHSKSR